MMTPDQLDLARRYAADPRWRWRPGMVAVRLRGESAARPRGRMRMVWRGAGDEAQRDVWMTGGGEAIVQGAGLRPWWWYRDIAIPDLTDPSTADLLPAWEPAP